MSRVTKSINQARRGVQVAGAFLRMDLIEAISYPLSLVMTGANALVGVTVWAFVAQHTGTSGPSVGNDYYTFVVIGLIGMAVLQGALNGFSQQIGEMMQRGRLEMILVEPVRWRLLPFGMGEWVILKQCLAATIMVAVSLLLGARMDPNGVPIALLVLFLGVAATFTVGVLSATIKVLSKRSDPVLALYQIAALILSGVFYPVDVLPSALRALSWLVPHTYVIAALRSVLLTDGELFGGLTASRAILILVLFCAVGYPISLWLFGRSLEYGRKMGLLSGY